MVNMLVPDDSYGIPIENWMQPILEELYAKNQIVCAIHTLDAVAMENEVTAR